MFIIQNIPFDHKTQFNKQLSDLKYSIPINVRYCAGFPAKNGSN